MWAELKRAEAAAAAGRRMGARRCGRVLMCMWLRAFARVFTEYSLGVQLREPCAVPRRFSCRICDRHCCVPCIAAARRCRVHHTAERPPPPPARPFNASSHRAARCRGAPCLSRNFYTHTHTHRGKHSTYAAHTPALTRMRRRCQQCRHLLRVDDQAPARAQP